MAILGLDVGTSYCKGAVFSEQGACLARAQRGYDILRPQAGWAELDANGVVEAGRFPSCVSSPPGRRTKAIR